MRTVLSLLKLQLDNKSDLLKKQTPKSLLLLLIKVIVPLLLATFVVSYGLSQIINLGFLINRELLAIILLATQFISLVFAVGNTINTLYLSKDNELFFCLPVTPNQLFISKLLSIYVNELAINSLMLIPIFLTLGSSSKFVAGPLLPFYLSLVILLFVLPILPIVFAAFLSIPIMSVIKFLKKHTFLAIVTIFALVSACLWVYISFIGSIASEFDISNKMYETVRTINNAILAIGKYIPVYYQLAGAMTSFSLWYYFPIYIVGCALVSFITIVFTRYFFFKTAMSSVENTIKASNINKEKHFKKRGITGSLFLKELYCIFRSSSDVFEYFLFTLLMPFIVFSYDKLLMSVTVNQIGENMKSGAHLMVVAILAMLSNLSSASAVSRDGGNFYMSKIVPVSYFKQMYSKFIFNATFTVSSIILTTAVSLIYPFKYDVWQVILGSVAVIFAAIGHIAFSIDSDIKNPTVSNGGDEKSSAVSKSTPLCLAYGLAIGFVMGLIVILMSGLENKLLPYLILTALSFVFMVYRVHTMVLRINLKYDKIEM